MNIKLRTLNLMLAGALGVAIPGAAHAQSATFTFDTMQTATPQFAPNNIVAVWIETPGGTFVRTLAQWAATRKQYLLAWNTSSKGNNVDAVTGATFTAHGTRTVSWDLRDVNKTMVANGNYVVKMELADRNATSTAQNNEAAFTFTVGPTPVNMTTSAGRFNKVMIVYTPTGSAPDMGTTQGQDAGTVDAATGGDAGSGGGGSAPTGCSMTRGHAVPGTIPWRGLAVALGVLAVLRRRLRSRAL